jgi:uncharacterized lipoprotein
MNATRFSASVVFLAVLVGCAQAPRSEQPAPAATVSSSQAAEPAVTPAAVQMTAIADRAAFWRQLTQRLDRPPFTLDYLHRGRGQVVATYDGELGPYVACGSSVGVAQPAAAGAQRLQSRVIVRVVKGSGGSSSVATDTIHVVSLGGSASQGPDIVTVRADAPARTRDGRYCWSTGAMERLTLAQ